MFCVLSTRSAFSLVMAFFAVALAIAPADAAVQSIEEFNARAEDWPQLSAKKTPITVEGRYSTISRIALKMKNCEILFRPAAATEIPKVALSTVRIEVSGHLQPENGKTVFVVERLRELQSDMDELKQRSRAVRKENAEDLYALGDWAFRRGSFYNDSDLIVEAERLRLAGITLERRQVPRDKPEILFQLAGKATLWKLPDSLGQELVHEAFHRQWEMLRSDNDPNYAELGERMARDLPGAEVPLLPPQPKLEQRYHASPLSAYQEATTEERQKMHRILYADLTLAKLVFFLKPDASNGISVADQILEKTPEHREKAESLIERELAYRFERIPKSSRKEAIELSELYRQRKNDAQARKTLSNWLSARESLLKQDGPDGLKRLAEEYLNLLEDESKAVELLKEAWKQSPDSEEIAQRLERLGFRQKDGQWMTIQEYKALPQDPIVQAMARGEVVVGMTSSQVRKSLGEPSSIARFVTAAGVSEVWSYGNRGTSRLAIHLSRRSIRGSEAKVTQFQREQ